MYEFVAKGLRTTILTVCALGASAAIAQIQPAQTAPANLDAVSSTASRYSVLSDALWTMGSDAVPERLDTAQAAFAANPRSAEANLRLGLAMRLEHPEAAALIQRFYEEALRLDPKAPRAYAVMGEFLSDQGDAEGVARNYQAWLAFAPNDPRAHLSYALALGRLGQMPEARAALDKSLALGPISAAYQLKAVLAEGGPPEEVLTALEAALKVGGGEDRIYYYRARMRWARGETGLALADVAKGLEYAPTSFRFRQLRGEINADAGRYDLAIAEYDALIAQQPGWPDLINDRCWARARAGVDLQKALVDCDTALGLDPGRAEALDSRGLVKLRLGDLPGALADYDEALKTDPPVPTALFGRGVVKRRSGDPAGGDADLGKARALEPAIDQQFARFGVNP
ncbi:tetratricopeptide repeat protein [Caulobacter segnis]